MTAEEIKKQLIINDFIVIKALQLLYAEQTDDEQDMGMTENLNGRGFNATDAPFCSSLAQQVINGKELSFKQLGSLRKILPKYSKQISVLWKK